MSGYQFTGRCLAVLICAALGGAVAACEDHPDPPSGPHPALSPDPPASAAPALAAVPKCAQVQRLVRQALPGAGNMSETPYYGNAVFTVQDHCVFDAPSAEGGHKLVVVVVVRYGRFVDGIDGRTADESATRPTTDVVTTTCAESPHRVGTTLVCTNESGELRSGAGLVADGAFAAADVAATDGEVVTTRHRTAAEAAARTIAQKTLDELS
ncbi:hypothetical protein ACTOB_005736 [Actinoplanes oblitus]|uniref:DUF3558 domain-containing protein n=1 Tax=Actinoplanes oblitus TaxID=3040509 RepID=A0ABY8WDF9_9ACTN|nr:hypothetical protein [Actinoplanes oblitus]WIM93750.1 hypothetical protein ACTOB_005736 [Actinoplanes oblitus]